MMLLSLRSSIFAKVVAATVGIFATCCSFSIGADLDRMDSSRSIGFSLQSDASIAMDQQIDEIAIEEAAGFLASHDEFLASHEEVVRNDVLAEAEPTVPLPCSCGESPDDQDRFWLISTRHLTSSANCADLEEPDLAIFRMHGCSSTCRVTLSDYLEAIGQRGAAVVYVHGNRIPAQDAVDRGFAVYRNVNRCLSTHPIDWVIWSWPSEKQGVLIHDARRKASKTDGQGLYLGWLLRRHAQGQVNTTLIGYSFGGRIITGSLHAAAGGALAGRKIPGEPVVGGSFDAGLVAPAVDSHWLTRHGYHRFATQNLNRLVLLYNRRDAVLKRYWLIDRVRGRMALGYSGPTSFAPRVDGSKLPVSARDCSPSVGLRHDELDYYKKQCRAGSEFASLIDDLHGNE